eukprot:CAMPEP_0197863404 /NCGR_PEP_ID=MMETSP1438-20131217/40836_1 /TAXON_ID=1461541 /ORGANISM="Pterosperma sp., Strain CCMP1384" /LENGTH=729 /DNA_ID=CAMNT_0043481283 /DNA_START=377 /DNA_END=2562 /DNA_ORIENTATION=-
MGGRVSILKVLHPPYGYRAVVCRSDGTEIRATYIEDSRGLQDALDSGLVKPIGGTTSLNSDGTLQNTASFDKIPSTWKPPLKASLTTYKQTLGPRLIGVYLRGSLPRGIPLEGVSDIDTIAYAFDDDPTKPLTSIFNQPPCLDEARKTIEHFQSSVVEQFPFCKKIEMKVVLISPTSSLGVCLREHMKYAEEQDPEALPPVLPSTIPEAFVLSSQSITLTGLDIPLLLPRAAAAPRENVRSLVKATRANVLLGDVNADVSPSRIRWGLRRCLRGVALVVMETDWVYTRDLYYCCQRGAKHAPHMTGTLVQALVLAIGSKPLDAPAERQAGLRCLSELLDWLESKATGSDELARKRVKEVMTSVNKERSGADGQLTIRKWQGERRSVRGKIQKTMRVISTWGGAMWGRDLERDEEESPILSEVHCSGVVPQYDWLDESERQQAWEVLQTEYCCSHFNDEGEGEASELGPIHLRRAVQHWRACGSPDDCDDDCEDSWGWTLNSLVKQYPGFEGLVRMSASNSFMFCEQRHLDVLRGDFEPPSWTSSMTIAEFAHLIQPQVRARAAQGEGMRCYMQAVLDERMLADIDLTSPPFPACIVNESPHHQNNHQSNHQNNHQNNHQSQHVPGQQAPLQMSQPPRMWMSQGGAVSPLHYDTSASFLIQIRGSKRLLFYPPSATPGLYPYPDEHPLRRRSKVDIEAPDLTQFPLFKDVPDPLEVVLNPGDVLYFPPYW